MKKYDLRWQLPSSCFACHAVTAFSAVGKTNWWELLGVPNAFAIRSMLLALSWCVYVSWSAYMVSTAESNSLQQNCFMFQLFGRTCQLITACVEINV